MGGLPGPIAWSYDFGNTVTYGFVAPDDAIVATASGIAPGGQATEIPLPSTALPLGLGLAVLGLRRGGRGRVR